MCSAVASGNLYELHRALCHPGVTRMMAFVRSRNLPYSIDDVKAMCGSCVICNRCKPQFYRPIEGELIKATQPFERLSVDFKGPLPSVTRNKYLLVLIDEFSRFPFVYPCKDASTESVLQSCSHLFSIFGMPAHMHSDNGKAFKSKSYSTYMHAKGISTGYSTPYHPQGNGQVEKLNGTVWQTILLALEDRGLSVEHWESVLPDVLHSIRSLICTTTNETPHERLFIHRRKSVSGASVPSWMAKPGPVLLRRHNRQSKYEPIVEDVELVSANPYYAVVQTEGGRQMTVSTRDLAPITPADPGAAFPVENCVGSGPSSSNQESEPVSDLVLPPVVDSARDPDSSDTTVPAQPSVRRSTRVRKPPTRLDL